MRWWTKLLKLKKWLCGFFATQSKEAQKRGEESEARVFKVIQEMLVWKELPTRKRNTFPYRTEKWSDQDMRGIDIVVPTKRGDIHIQVKSSARGRKEFISQSRNRDIICINGQRSEADILKELRTKLPIAYSRLQ